MSIYRKPGNSMFSDINVHLEQGAKESADQPAPTTSEAQLLAERASEEAEKRKRKRGEPLNVPLPRTLAWAAELPPEVRPHELIRLYARIANQLASGWDEPDATRAYFNELLVSRRPRRKGFPKQVESEIVALCLHYMLLHPERGSVINWQSVQKS